MNSLNRRNFLTTAAALGTFTLFGTAPIAHAAAAPKTARSIGDVLSMSPIEVAQESDVVQTAWQMILGSAKKLQNAQTRAAVLKILENPAPTIVNGDESTIRAVLIEKGLLDAKRKKVFPENGSASASPQPFWSAPGSGFASLIRAVSLRTRRSTFSPRKISTAATSTSTDSNSPTTTQWAAKSCTTSTSPGSSSGSNRANAARKKRLPPRANTTFSRSPNR